MSAPLPRSRRAPEPGPARGAPGAPEGPAGGAARTSPSAGAPASPADGAERTVTAAPREERPVPQSAPAAGGRPAGGRPAHWHSISTHAARCAAASGAPSPAARDGCGVQDARISIFVVVPRSASPPKWCEDARVTVPLGSP
ncbi:hypothetical protein GCM10010400_32710 [Streptomyces aculeolatus]